MPNKKKKTIPDFATEKQEAEWYFAHRNELDNYFELLTEAEMRDHLAMLPPREVAMAQAKEATERYKARTVATSIRLSRDQIEAAKKIAARKGLKYQTWMKSVIHQAIEAEKGRV